MTYETRDNSGSLFTNDRKTEERQPGWKGEAKIAGIDYWVSAWVKPTKAGGKWISLAFDAKDQAKNTAAPAPAADFDDELPF